MTKNSTKDIEPPQPQVIREQLIDGWLDDHLHEIRECQSFAIDELPDEPHALGQHLSIAQSMYPRMGFLLTDAEAFVLAAHAAAVVRVKQEYGDWTAEERRVLAKADLDYIAAKKLRDNLEVVVQALKAKGFSIMNLNRTILNPTMQSGCDA